MQQRAQDGFRCFELAGWRQQLGQIAPFDVVTCDLEIAFRIAVVLDVDQEASIDGEQFRERAEVACAYLWGFAG